MNSAVNAKMLSAMPPRIGILVTAKLYVMRIKLTNVRMNAR